MKIGTLTQVFNVSLGVSTPYAPFVEEIKFRTFIDGTISPINLGARNENIAEFQMINISKTDFVILNDFLILNSGEAINIIPANDGENIFPEQVYSPNGYMVYVLEPKALQEEDFSVTDTLYTVTLKVSLRNVGNIDGVPNVANSSIYDVLIRIDSTLAELNITPEYSQDSEPIAVDGEYWWDTDDLKLYKYTSGVFVAQTVKRWFNISDKKLYRYITSASKYKLMYTVSSDNTDVGFFNGSFFLSAFSDVVRGIEEVGFGSLNYKSGLLTANGINFPSLNINIDNGPSIARREGFSFSVDNADKFWNFIVVNNINLFGARVTMWMLHSNNITKISTGENVTNSFSYTNYEFEVDPFILSDSGVFPKESIQDTSDVSSRYTDIEQDMIGKKPFATYGEWELASLQNVTTTPKVLTIKKNDVDITVFTGVLSENGFSITFDTEYVFTDIIDEILKGDTTLTVRSDSIPSSNNIGVVRRVVEFDSGNNKLIFDDTFPTVQPPLGTFTQVVSLIRNSYKFQIDETQCGGFGSFENGLFNNVIKLYGISDNGRDIIEIPESNFDVIDSLKNSIAINPATATDVTKIDTYIGTKTFNPPMFGNIAGLAEADKLDKIDNTKYNDYFSDLDNKDEFETLGVSPTGYTDGGFDTIHKLSPNDSVKNYIAYLMPYIGQTANRKNNPLRMYWEGFFRKQNFNSSSSYKGLGVTMSNAGEKTAQNGMLTLFAKMDVLHPPKEIDFIALEDVRLGVDINIKAVTNIKQEFWLAIESIEWLIGTPPNSYSRMVLKDEVLRPILTSDLLQTKFVIFNVNNALNSNYVTLSERPVGSQFFSTAFTIIGVDELTREIIFLNNNRVSGDLLDESETGFPSSKAKCMLQAKPVYIQRSGGVGVSFGIAFERNDGTVITDPDWFHSIAENELSRDETITANTFVGKINNMPSSDGVGGGFSINSPVLTNFWQRKVRFIFANILERDSHDKSDIAHGDMCWVIDTGVIGFQPSGLMYMYRTFTSQLQNTQQSIQGDGWNFSNYTNASIGEKLWHYYSGVNNISNLYNIANNGAGNMILVLDTLTPKTQQLRGRDLFDLSKQNIFGSLSIWNTIVSMQLIISIYPTDSELYAGEHNEYLNDTHMTWKNNRNVLLDITFNSTPEIFHFKEMEIVDRPLFASVRGRTISDPVGVFPTSAKSILTDLLTKMYGVERFDYANINTLMSKDGRNYWNWRRQFTNTSGMSNESVLKELSYNLWAGVIFDVNDKIYFKSLIIGATSIKLSDSNILKDSITEIRYRNKGDIYQTFEILYKYYPPSEFSKALNEYELRNFVSTDNINSSADLTFIIEQSKRLYNIDNKLPGELSKFIYHYEDNFPLTKHIVKWFAYNSWTFKLKIRIEDSIGLQLLDTFLFSSFFHSNNLIVKGFITSIKMDIYEGVCELGCYIAEPIGKNVTECDPFKDALQISPRDTSDWDILDQINDAGNIALRPEMLLDDAGKISLRTFDCVHSNFPQDYLFKDAGLEGRTLGDYIQNDAGLEGRVLGDYVQNDASTEPR